jgi:hypothetical protein
MPRKTARFRQALQRQRAAGVNIALLQPRRGKNPQRMQRRPSSPARVVQAMPWSAAFFMAVQSPLRIALALRRQATSARRRSCTVCWPVRQRVPVRRLLVASRLQFQALSFAGAGGGLEAIGAERLQPIVVNWRCRPQCNDPRGYLGFGITALWLPLAYRSLHAQPLAFDQRSCRAL